MFFMANFKTHLVIASGASTGAAFMAVNMQLVSAVDTLWLIFLGAVGGMLPDIDASNSRPVRLLFSVLALMGVAGVMHIFNGKYTSYQLLIAAGVTYPVIRYGIFALFNRLTIHRGVFHSLLAALFFTLLMTCISYYFIHLKVIQAWLNGLFIAIGFIVHLFLDELYSVDLLNSRMKKSFGTAMKVISYNNIPASVLMMLCTAFLYWAAPSPLPLIKALKMTQGYVFKVPMLH
jgi:hypothetical protein